MDRQGAAAGELSHGETRGIQTDYAPMSGQQRSVVGRHDYSTTSIFRIGSSSAETAGSTPVVVP